ncbi:MAG: sigma factor-like helix-turn-helix DNA-binding protein, partial [Planctomycetota bacterium]
SSYDPYEQLKKKESVEKIWNCLSKLPLILKESLFLKFIENLSLSQISARTGIPKSTAALKVQEGLLLLNRCFNGVENET